MTKHYRFTVLIKTELPDQLQYDRELDVLPDVLDKVRRLYDQLKGNEKVLMELIKLNFVDLLLADSFSETIRTASTLAPDIDLILQAAAYMDNDDYNYFALMRKIPHDQKLKEQQDSIVTLLLQQLDTAIESVKFDTLSETAVDTQSL